MQVLRIHFPDIIPDNDELYIAHLIGIIESRDELSHLQITKISNGYNFRISPSIPMYNNHIIEGLLNFHNMLGIKVDFSKSIKSSGTLSFNIHI
jgi:hypothetical protein